MGLNVGETPAHCTHLYKMAVTVPTPTRAVISVCAFSCLHHMLTPSCHQKPPAIQSELPQFSLAIESALGGHWGERLRDAKQNLMSNMRTLKALVVCTTFLPVSLILNTLFSFLLLTPHYSMQLMYSLPILPLATVRHTPLEYSSFCM